MNKSNKDIYNDLYRGLFDVTDVDSNDLVYIDVCKIIKNNLILETKASDLTKIYDRIKKIPSKKLIEMSNEMYRDIINVNIDDIKEDNDTWNEYCVQLTVLHVCQNFMYKTPINLVDPKDMKEAAVKLINK